MEAALSRIVGEIEARRGIDLSGYRSATLRRRISARVARVCRGDIDEYLRRLIGDRLECDRLIETITIKVSAFFRDPALYELLAGDVLPEIISRKRAAVGRDVRVWSAGCAAGEEPYSVAILLDRLLGTRLSEWSCLIFGTDLDEAALERARAGVYGRRQLAHTQLGVIDAYFTPVGDDYELRPSIRNMVHLSRADLLSPDRAIPTSSVFGSFDLVLCRNVLIYFSPEAQLQALERLGRSLAPGGYLILGESETLRGELDRTLHAVDRRHRIFQRTPSGKSGQEPVR